MRGADLDEPGEEQSVTNEEQKARPPQTAAWDVESSENGELEWPTPQGPMNSGLMTASGSAETWLWSGGDESPLTSQDYPHGQPPVQWTEPVLDEEDEAWPEEDEMARGQATGGETWEPKPPMPDHRKK